MLRKTGAGGATCDGGWDLVVPKVKRDLGGNNDVGGGDVKLMLN